MEPQFKADVPGPVGYLKIFPGGPHLVPPPLLLSLLEGKLQLRSGLFHFRTISEQNREFKSRP